MKTQEKINKLKEEFNKRITELEEKLNEDSGYKPGDWVLGGENEIGKHKSFIFRIEKICDKEIVASSTTHYLSDEEIHTDYSEYYCDLRDITRKLTEKEIEDYLIKEADRRGYKIGVKYIGCYTEAPVFEIKEKLKYYIGVDQLTDGCGGTVYLNGKWAEIIKDESLRICGHKVEINGPQVKIGCKDYSLKRLLKLIKDLKDFEITQMVVSGETITKTEINKLYEFLNNDNNN